MRPSFAQRMRAGRAILFCVILAAALAPGAAAATGKARSAATGPGECPNFPVSGLGVYEGILRSSSRDAYTLFTRCGKAEIVDVTRATIIRNGLGTHIAVGQLRTPERVEVSGTIRAGTIRAARIQFI